MWNEPHLDFHQLELKAVGVARRLSDSNDPMVREVDSSVDRIAAEIGYSDGVTLRSLLRRKLGRGVRELRSRHG
jgi:transcriptional regulator GlxA family with amidase domain